MTPHRTILRRRRDIENRTLSVPTNERGKTLLICFIREPDSIRFGKTAQFPKRFLLNFLRKLVLR
jgi:hypothetical protein